MKKIFAIFFTVAMLIVAVAPTFAAQPGFGQLYYDGTTVRTAVPPANSPHGGQDNFYVVPDQMAIAGVAPGDTDYHGGQWAVHVVSWNEGVSAYELTSEDAVLAAATAGDVTIDRIPEADFLCPIQP
jgi:hypothetical protein